MEAGDQTRRYPRRPKWSLVSSFLGAIGILAVVVPLVFVFVHKSVWDELELMISILSFFVFAFLFTILFYGVRFVKNEKFRFNWFKSHSFDLMEYGPIDTGGAIAEGLSDGGPLGCLLGLLLDLIVSILLTLLIAVLLWVGLNLMEAVITAVSLPLFLIFRRSLRYVVVQGRSCRGNVRKSLLHAALFTAMGSVWFYSILYAAYLISRVLSF